MRYFVVSKLSASVIYNLFKSGPDGKPYLTDSVPVRGGAGIAREGRGQELITDVAEGTEVTEEQVALLNQCPTFKLHKQNGFVDIQQRMDLPDMEKAALDLTSETEKSAPLNPAILEAEAEAAEKADQTAVKLVDSNKVEKVKAKK